MQRISLSVSGSRAQAAVFDALIFFVVMILASALINVYQVQVAHTQKVGEYSAMQDTAEAAKLVIIHMTLYNTTYLDENGEVVQVPPMSTSIQDLILLELKLQSDGIPRENFEALEVDVEKEIAGLIPAHYEFSLKAGVENSTIENEYLFDVCSSDFSRISGSADICSEEWCCGVPGSEHLARFQLLLWY